VLVDKRERRRGDSLILEGDWKKKYSPIQRRRSQKKRGLGKRCRKRWSPHLIGAKMHWARLKIN